MSRSIRPGVRVVGLPNGLLAIGGGCCCSASIRAGIRIVGSSPVRAAIWSVGGASVAVGPRVGVLGVVAVWGGVRVVIPAIHIRLIVVTSTVGYDGAYRGTGDEHSHVSRGIAGRHIAGRGRELGHVCNVVHRRTGRNRVDNLRYGRCDLPGALRAGRDEPQTLIAQIILTTNYDHFVRSVDGVLH